MNDSSARDPQRLKKWLQQARNSTDPNLRIEALLEIRHFDDPRIPTFFEAIGENDRDSEVRDLAKNLLTKKKIELGLSLNKSEPAESPIATIPVPTESQFEESTHAHSGAMTNADAWECEYCGGVHDKPRLKCMYCDSPRSLSQKTKGKSKRKGLIGGNAFLFHEKNRDYLTGKQSKPVSGRAGCLILFLIPFLVIGIGMAIYGVKLFSDWQTLNERGVTRQGIYLSSERIEDDDGDYDYYATYSYVVNERQYTARQSISSGLYRTLIIGAEMTVIVDPQNPLLVRINGTNSTDEFMFLFVFSFCWNLVIIVVFVGAFNSLLRRRKRLKHGQVIFGEVVDAQKEIDSDNDCRVRITYEFITPNGIHEAGKTNEINNAMKNRRLPLTGVQVAILYHDIKNYELL